MGDRDETPGSGSSLSDIDSDEFPENLKYNRSRSHSNASTISGAASAASATPSTSTPQHPDMPAAKRRRTGASTYDHPTPQSSGLIPQPRSPTGSISSDSSGSVPTSPSFAHLGPTHPLSTAYAAAQANPDNPEMADYVQITKCQWTNCKDPEQGDMDKLVNHINDVHIPPRQKKYFCEWEGCNRKSMPHTSAYALKAHMRSHTKEKPFMCQLPECDRSFTRSDALAKHMRTVHETEALRPSDPVPRGHTGGISGGANSSNGTIKRIKLVLNNGDKKLSVLNELPPLPNRSTVIHSHPMINPDHALAKLTSVESADPELADAIDIDALPFTLPVSAEYYPTDVYASMDEFERTLPPSQYFRLLRRQLKWAQEEGDQLSKELADARCTTDDLQGIPILRATPGAFSSKDSDRQPLDERIGDDIRKDEWNVVESLLDKLLKAEMLSLVNDDDHSDPLSNDAASSRELMTVDGILDDTKPWALLQSFRGHPDPGDNNNNNTMMKKEPGTNDHKEAENVDAMETEPFEKESSVIQPNTAWDG